MTNSEYANALRQIADFYDQNPEMPNDCSLDVFTHEDDEALERGIRCLSSTGRMAVRGAKNFSYFVGGEVNFGGVSLAVLGEATKTIRHDERRRLPESLQTLLDENHSKEAPHA